MATSNLFLKSSLHRAVHIGDLEELKKLLTQGEDINSRFDLTSEQGSFACQLTPLMIAAGSGDGATVETLQFLVENGADIYAKSAGDTTAAWYAASHGNISRFFNTNIRKSKDYANKLFYLLEQGLDPWECANNGRSLISEACRLGDIHCISLLLEKGVKPISNSHIEELNSFQIPLFCAVESNFLPCVEMIINTGVYINIKDRLNRNALFYASSLEIAQILIEHEVNLNLVDIYRDDAFQSILTEHFSENTRFKICRYMLEHGLSVDRLNFNGCSRLVSLAYELEIDNIKFLLSVGANPHLIQDDHSTPLHASCWEYDGSPELQGKNQIMKDLIELFLKIGININSIDIDGNTPLHIAVSGNGGSVTAVSTLLSYGADPNIANNEGATPLMLASFDAEFECIQVLLSSGANYKIKDKQELSALDYACEYYIHLVNEKRSFLGNYDSKEYALERVQKCINVLSNFKAQ
jgi:ankyrin repeat protein